MKLKIFLATGTALGLLAASGIAYAGSGNNASLKQQGSSNTASIDQSGASGSDAGKYASGPNFLLWQIGDGNALNVEQTGKSNQIAVNTSLGLAAETYTDSNGVKHTSLNGIQAGDNNTATIRQDGGTSYEGNQIGSYYQINDDNTLTLTQTGTRKTDSGVSIQNAIRKVYQRSMGGANGLTITQTSDSDGLPGAYGNDGYARGNTIGIVRQDGSGDTGTLTQFGSRNYVASFSQIGSDNTATVSQNGTGNRLNILSQSTDGNTATLTFDGDYNGADSGTSDRVLGGIFGRTYATAAFASSLAGNVGVTQGTATQSGGGGNVLSYKVVGNSNAFGFNQTGGGLNRIGGVVAGDFNEVAILQDGGSNLASFVQTGVGNDLGISQTGDGNSATINATGDDNMVGVTQIATAAGINVLNVDIFGSNNGGGTFTVGGNAASLGLDAGTIYQENDGGLTNSIDLDVGDSGTPLSANLFALKQVGTGNTIIGKVSTGDGNEVAVLQDGNSNTANFTQSGGGNNISISQ